jgi:glutamyl-tRNA reductase
MHITLVGVSHKTAPVAVRERFAFAPGELASALRGLAEAFDGGVALLSTCNRTEAYVASHHAVAPGTVSDALCKLSSVGEVPDDVFYHHTGREATRHLFRVASGIESMVLGESEILGQVRGAFAAATAAGTHNAVLSQLFHTAIRVGRQVRSQTGIGRLAVSISSTAVALARRELGDLESKTVLVVSAGEAGKLAARSLAESGASKILVTSRTASRAAQLADDLAGEAVPFEPMSTALAQADIVVTSSASPEPVITPDDVRDALALRPDRPLLVIDIAVPRDVDPAAGEIDNVRLFDIDHLQALVADNKNARRQEVAKAELIVDEGLEKFTDWVRARSVVPTVASLQARAESVRAQEVERTLKGKDGLTPAQQRRVDAMSKAIVKKMLHDPITRLKGADGERYAAAVRELFDLDANDSTDEPED